ncbi:ABC transporter ATP-binding protein [Streptosporangium sp. NPDC049248]|uniref:ABC transporter ATP-binding protein n=1 Tax=Streptosporangium sp. NPDC049248 TaxID=3155651 RepID=UPI00343F3AD1
MSTDSVTGASARPVVNVKGVSKAFGDNQILDNVDIEIPPGEFVSILGRSGTGKSTLLRIIAGLDTEISGNVTLRADAGVMFQDARLLPWLSVADNIVLGSGVRPDDPTVRELLTRVGLDSIDPAAWPKTLSGGQSQRVALARVLIRTPRLLLLDEPFGALDALTRIRMQRLLGDVRENYHLSAFLVTHDVEEALVLSDRIVILDGGKLIFDEILRLPAPQERTSPDFAAKRNELLRLLGVA